MQSPLIITYNESYPTDRIQEVRDRVDLLIDGEVQVVPLRKFFAVEGEPVGPGIIVCIFGGTLQAYEAFAMANLVDRGVIAGMSCTGPKSNGSSPEWDPEKIASHFADAYVARLSQLVESMTGGAL